MLTCKTKILFLLMFLAGALSLQAEESFGNVHSQDGDYGVLESIHSYKPPPMFESKDKPAPEDFATPPTIEKKPPTPGHKPFAEFSMFKQKKFAYEKQEDLPKPKKRPQVFHASQSFLREAKTKAEPVSNRMPKIDNIDVAEETLYAPPSDSSLAPLPSSLNTIETASGIQKPLKTPTKEQIMESAKNVSYKPSEDQNSMRSKLEKEQKISLGYKPQAIDLPTSLAEELEGSLISTLKGNESLRVEIQSFASPLEEDTNLARRLSLARALNIRNFLMQRDINPGRIDVRPLGNKTDITPKDRVDIILRP